MQSPSARRTTSLSALAAKLAPPEAPPPRRADPVDILAGMLDLRGSVRLAELVTELLPALDEKEPGNALSPSFLGQLESRVLAILEEVPKAFESLHRPARVLRAIRAEEDARAGARALTERFEEAMARAIARARSEIRALREEIAETLRGAGPRAAALEQLDTALVLATRGTLSSRLASIVPFAATAFEELVTQRLVVEGEGLELSKVEVFCRPDGWLGRAVAEGEATALAIARVEAGILVALVEAAGGRE